MKNVINPIGRQLPYISIANSTSAFHEGVLIFFCESMIRVRERCVVEITANDDRISARVDVRKNLFCLCGAFNERAFDSSQNIFSSYFYVIHIQRVVVFFQCFNEFIICITKTDGL